MSPGPVSDSMGSGEVLRCAFCEAPVSSSAVGEADRNPLVEHVLACPEHPLGQKIRALSATPLTLLTLEEIATERRRQDAKWGEQNHDPFLYLTILGEEFGEACEAALRARFPGDVSEEDRDLVVTTILFGDLRSELVQVAAVAVAAIECIDRSKWKWGGHAQEVTP